MVAPQGTEDDPARVACLIPEVVVAGAVVVDRLLLFLRAAVAEEEEEPPPRQSPSEWRYLRLDRERHHSLHSRVQD